MAIAPYITSKQGLKKYIKEVLGEPVVTVQVTDEQLEHIINKVTEKFVDYVSGGTQLRYLNLDISAGIQEYQLAEDVYAIQHIYDTTSIDLGSVFPEGSFTAGTFSGGFREVSHSLGTYGHKHDLLSIELTRQHIQTLNFMLSVQVSFNYNSTSNKLYLMESPKAAKKLGIIYYQIFDYSGDTHIYDHTWFKRYSVEQARKQWGTNLMKFNGSILPGGLTIDATAILTEAKEEIEKLDQELEEIWREPIDFITG